uniref:50S ribosomal protein L20 n=1 Tax=Gymnochlora stellata TaxID=67809 RepID=A0A140JZH9_GYMST|nr:50S ribosomal protein L20 [Gymnochlora stellata]BAU62506.1 50S ribosomal protein L20 [Gymnochlora stellata]
MTRVKRGKITSKSRRKRVYNSKGFRQSWSTITKVMIQSCLKALNSSYSHRRKRSNTIRRLLILRTNALTKSCGLPITYNNLIALLRSQNCLLNRKILNNLGVRDNSVFLQLMRYYSQ